MTRKNKQPNISINITASDLNAKGNITIGEQYIDNSYRSNLSITIESFLGDIDSITNLLRQSQSDHLKLDEIATELEAIRNEAKKDNPDKKPLLERVKLAFDTISATFGATEAIGKLAPLIQSALQKAHILFR